MPTQAVRVFSRSTVHTAISMWASLHLGETGKAIDWLVDTWTEIGVTPPLKPKLHWVSHEDGKFYDVQLNIDFRSSLKLFGKDSEIEPNRAAFIRATLRAWE
ncbi:MAG: hypothetical protein LAO08_20025 [Acidobacteriia bacterium]|nr:hypothetical protein [Terriglobia bacterium]